MKTYFTFIALFLSTILFANKTIYFEHITQSNGLPSNDVTQIFQDSDGLMWFATYNGLASYDGYTFKKYNYSPTDSTTINHDLILYITEETPRYLLVGTYQGFCRFDKEQDKFKRFIFPDMPGLTNASIRKIVIDDNGKIWLATNMGMAIYDQQNDSVILYTNDPENDNTICAGSILELFFDSNNQVWIGSRTGLDLFDRSTKTFTHLYKDEEFEKIIPYNSGVLAITRTFNRYYTPSVDNIEFEEDLFREDKPGFVFTDILTNYRGAEWYAIREYGIFIEDQQTKELINYASSKYKPDGINSNVPQCLFVDKDSNLWIGTFDGGVNFFSPHRKVFHNLKDNFSESGLMNNKVKTIFQDRDGDIWVGTKVGGMLSNFDINTQTFTHYRHNPNDPKSISDEYIFAITDAEPGYLWVGTMKGGLNHFNKSTGKCQVFRHDPKNEKSLTSNNIKTMLVDNGILWISYHRQGIDRFDIRKGIKIRNYQVGGSRQGYVPSNTTYKIFKDSKGRLWFVTDFGLGRYNYEQDNFTNYYFNENDSTSLSDNIIFCVHEDADKNLWFGTKNGLNRYNPNTDDFTVFNTKTGLPSNAIYGLASDKKGNLWISTNTGLYRYDWKTGSARLYTVEDGLQNNEFVPSVYETSIEGYIFFGGNEGFTYFKPDEIRDNPIVPKIMLTNFKIFNQSVRVGDDNNVLKKHISKEDHIWLNHKQSVFSFEFTALNYNSPAKNQYAYMMEGFDEDWQYVGTIRTATYTNLNPGDYTFHVKASNNDGLWNQEGTSIEITITPPWWATLWFRITAILISIIILLMIYYINVNQIKKKNIYLENKVKERTREINNKNKLLVKRTHELKETNFVLEERQQQIEEQTEELIASNEKLTESIKKLSELNQMKDKIFSIIGHDLKNPINTIMGFSEMLKLRRDKLAKEKQHVFVDNIFLAAKNTYQLLESLLNWARSQNERMKFEPKENKMDELIMESILILREQALKKHITVSLENHIEDCLVFCDTLMVKTVLRNLISNAIKFTEKDGEILINYTTKEKPGYSTIHIADKGLGISEEQIPGLFIMEESISTVGTEGEIGTGLGLILCKEFIERNMGNIWVKSKLGKGTTFSFTLPLASN